MVEIGHKNAGKGNTLLYLMRLLGISPDEAIAFGDADNDCSMLEAVKYGVAEMCIRDRQNVRGQKKFVLWQRLILLKTEKLKNVVNVS